MLATAACTAHSTYDNVKGDVFDSESLPCSLCELKCGLEHDSMAYDPRTYDQAVRECTDACGQTCISEAFDCGTCSDTCFQLCGGDQWCADACNPICAYECVPEPCDPGSENCGQDSAHFLVPAGTLGQFEAVVFPVDQASYSGYVKIGAIAGAASVGYTDVACTLAAGTIENSVGCEETSCYLPLTSLDITPPDMSSWLDALDVVAKVYAEFAYGPPGSIEIVNVDYGMTAQCRAPPGNLAFPFFIPLPALGAVAIVELTTDATFTDVTIVGKISWGYESDIVKQIAQSLGATKYIADALAILEGSTSDYKLVAYALLVLSGKDYTTVSEEDKLAAEAMGRYLVRLVEDVTRAKEAYESDRSFHERVNFK